MELINSPNIIVPFTLTEKKKKKKHQCDFLDIKNTCLCFSYHRGSENREEAFSGVESLCSH